MRKLTDRTLIARWVETTALNLRERGKTFEEIADLIGRMGRDEVPGWPREVQMPAGYRISHQAVQKAVRTALARLPQQEPDAGGYFRTHRDHMFLSRQPHARLARWVEDQALKLKRLGHTFDQIADVIGRTGRGELPDRPSEIQFPADYRISRQAIQKAVYKALYRAPNRAAQKFRQERERRRQEAEQFKRLELDRLEEMLFRLQPRIQRGHAPSINKARKILHAQSKIVGII